MGNKQRIFHHKGYESILLTISFKVHFFLFLSPEEQISVLLKQKAKLFITIRTAALPLSCG